jgi:hypothetical protein
VAVNPYTLQEETEEERRARQQVTGELGNGLLVLCRPTDDPAVVQQQHRAVCLTRPYQNCYYCPHSNFTFVFVKKDPEVLEAQRRTQVLCPRWQDRGFVSGKSPESYVSTELATCEIQPFEFCRDCPSIDALVQLGIDKSRDGWYSRWRRFTKEEDDEDEDG